MSESQGPAPGAGGTVTRSASASARRAPAHPFLFLLLDANQPLLAGARWDLEEVAEVSVGRGERGSTRQPGRGAPGTLAITLPDTWMSTSHARLRRRGSSWFVLDLGSRNGSRVGGVRIEGEHLLADGEVIEMGGSFFLFRARLPLPEGEPADLDLEVSPPAVPELATLVPGLAAQLRKLERLAGSDVAIVLQGETGTGKEVIARALHALSGRRGPFVAVNCGAIPETLVESELFGHKKGAFSGANVDRVGHVQNAHEGTLFLDEIGDMRARSQTALLRVLQERQVVPVGSTRGIDVDVRVLAATHEPLAEATEAGLFRPDLLARLSGFTALLPALDERREDLGLLVGACLRRIAPDRARQVTLSSTVVRLFVAHSWPMNVRELHKTLEAALVLAEDGRIRREHLGLREAAPASDRLPEPVGEALLAHGPERQQQLEELLREHHGNLTAVGRAIRRDRALVRRWLSRYGIEPDRFRRG